MDGMIRIGKIVNTHGTQGEIKILPLTDDVSRFKNLREVLLELPNGQYETLHPLSSRLHKDAVLMTLEEVTDMTGAQRLKERYLCVRREDAIKLPAGRYFIFELVGLTVVEDGQPLGKIVEVLQPGANDVYVVEDETGRQIYLPALKSVIHSVDLENKVMQVTLPLGLLD